MSQSSTFPAGKSYPFESGSGQEAGNAEWRKLASAFGDGIVNDVAGNAFAATPSSSDRTITVTLNELRLRGIHFEGVDPTTVITLSTPSAGFTRADRIVAHYDPSDKSVAITKHEGSAVNTGTPAPPALHRNAGGTWDLPLWRFTGGTGAATALTKLDERSWIGWQGFAANQGALPDVAPIASSFLALDTGHRWRRMLVSGTPTWVDLDAITVVNVDLAGGLTSDGTLPGFSVVNGVCYGRGSWIKQDGTNFAVGGGGADQTYSLGSIPVGYRPGVNRSFVVARVASVAGGGGSGTNVRVDITSGGTITAVVQGPNTGSVSRIRADNLVFPIGG